MRTSWKFAAATLALVVAAPALGQAPVIDSDDFDARLKRIERTLSNSSLMQLFSTVKDLEKELRSLRGELELQSHTIEKLQARQRDLYVDVDKRLAAVEGGPGAEGSPAVAPPAAALAPSAPASDPRAPAPVAPGATPPVAAARPPDQPAPAAATVDPALEQQAYRDAFALLKAGKFSQAAEALNTFLNDYPNGRFADNAQYWLGESYYVSRNFDPALQAFERLLVEYPDSSKRSHAMLKIGFIHDEAGRKAQAKQVLTELTQQYPQSTAASLAKKRLRRLQ